MSLIEIGDTSPRVSYTADGINKSFSFDFSIFELENVEVYLNNKLKTDGFEIYASDNNIGGEINFIKAPRKNTIVTICRNLDIKRKTDFSENKAFRAKSLNSEFDYQVLCLKQLDDKLKRSLSAPVSAEGDVNMALPEPNPGKAIVWDNDGITLRNSAVNIENLDAYANATEEATRALELATELSSNITDFIDTIEANTQLSQENAAELLNKININCNNISEEGVDALKMLVMPRPQMEEGLGQYIPISQNKKSVISPDGGTWFYFYINFIAEGSFSWNEPTQRPRSGITAGGTNLTGTMIPSYSAGFFWRLA